MEFTAVTPTRSYEHVVQQIEQQIASGALPWGQRLPTEREMSVRFGVSRVVVREAVRVLSTMGLVEVRHGSGVYVRNNLIPAISRGLTLSVTPEGRSVDRLFEFRATLETAAARFAAERREDGDMAAIDDSVAAMARAVDAEDVDAFAEADGRFHTAVGSVAGNAYLLVTLHAVRDMQGEISRRIAARSLPDVWAGSLAQHERIAEAIRVGNPEAAAAEMFDHITSTASRLHAILDASRSESDGPS